MKRKLQQLTLNAVAKKYPEKHIDNKDPKNLAIGDLTMHMLTPAVIEVAGGGQTIMPQLPQPYKTSSQTFSYANE